MSDNEPPDIDAWCEALRLTLEPWQRPLLQAMMTPGWRYPSIHEQMMAERKRARAAMAEFNAASVAMQAVLATTPAEVAALSAKMQEMSGDVARHPVAPAQASQQRRKIG